MAQQSDRRLMLDPGITALALRGLHRRDGHYPFLDRFRSRRRRTAAWGWLARIGPRVTRPAIRRGSPA
jgi:hypothetical protein